MDAQTRRRERRAEKQAQWKAANPLLVGVSAKPVNRPILSLNRKPKSRVESALNPIDLIRQRVKPMPSREELLKRKSFGSVNDNKYLNAMLRKGGKQ